MPEVADLNDAKYKIVMRNNRYYVYKRLDFRLFSIWKKTYYSTSKNFCEMDIKECIARERTSKRTFSYYYDDNGNELC